MTIYSSRQQHLNVFIGWDPTLKKYLLEIKDPFQITSEGEKLLVHAYSSDLEGLKEKAGQYKVSLEPFLLKQLDKDRRYS